MKYAALLLRKFHGRNIDDYDRLVRYDRCDRLDGLVRLVRLYRFNLIN
jgi:hypothetical protein